MQAGYLPARYYSGSAGLQSPCQPNLASLYAFGPAYGDSSANSDDGVMKLSVPGTPLAYFGVNTYSVVCVYANGAVILKAPGSSCSSGYFSVVPGPVYGSLGPGVLLFWQDIDSSTPLGTNGYPSAVQNTQYSTRIHESVVSRSVHDTLAPVQCAFLLRRLPWTRVAWLRTSLSRSRPSPPSAPRRFSW